MAIAEQFWGKMPTMVWPHSMSNTPPLPVLSTTLTPITNMHVENPSKNGRTQLTQMMKIIQLDLVIVFDGVK